MDVAFFDRTARGRLIVTGRDARDLLHRLATESLLEMEPGIGRAVCFCTNKGRLIDWTVVLDRGDDLLLLSGNPERLSGHIQQYTITEDVTVRNYMAIEIVVCGPGAREVLGVSLEPWEFCDTGFGEVKVQIVRIEPLFGDAYAILAPDAVALRATLARRGTVLDAAGVEELHVRAGIPSVPNEINEKHNPWEAGLGEYISLVKGCYVGQEVIARLNTYNKVQRRLVGLQLGASAVTGDPLTKDEEVIGEIGTVAGHLALGFVDADLIAPGTDLDGATIVELPMS